MPNDAACRSPRLVADHGDDLDNRARGPASDALLARQRRREAKTGASFTWLGAWEYDRMSGSGSVKLAKDGRLRGRIKIKGGDESTFVAERASEPSEPIPDPPSYRHKWGPRRRW